MTSLSNCHKLCIRHLVDLSKQDLRTVLCKNLESIAQNCNVQSRNLSKFCVKQNMTYIHIPLDQEWKLSILHELLKAKEDNFVLNNFNDRDRNHDQLFMFRLETIFIYYTLFLFLSYHILPFYLCVRNKSIIIIIIYKKGKQSHP